MAPPFDIDIAARPAIQYGRRRKPARGQPGFSGRPVILKKRVIDKTFVVMQMPVLRMRAYPLVQQFQRFLRLPGANRIRFGKKDGAHAIGVLKIRIQRRGDVEERRQVLVSHRTFVRLFAAPVVLDGPHPVEIREQAVIAQRHAFHGCGRAEVQQIGLRLRFAAARFETVLHRFDQDGTDKAYS